MQGARCGQLGRAETRENILLEDLQGWRVDRLPACGVQTGGGGAQVIARLSQARERPWVTWNGRVRAGKATEKVRTKMSATGARGDAGEGILAIESEHRDSGAGGARWAGAGRRSNLARRGLFDVPEEGALQRSHARAMLGLDLRRIDIADGGRDATVVGHRLHLEQIARGTIEGAQDAGPKRCQPGRNAVVRDAP